MSNPTPPPPGPTLDLYLDSLLSPEECADFERSLQLDAALTNQLLLQRNVDARLRELFAYAPPVTLPATLPETFSPSAAPPQPVSYSFPAARRRFVGLAALAASLLLAFTYVYWPRTEVKFISPDEAYRRLAVTGWVPAFICENDEQFIAAVRKRFNDSVLIPAATLGVVLNGWGYAEGYEGSPLSANAMFLLTHADGERVLVLMDSTSSDTHPKLSAASKGLNLFRRDVDGIVLYEISPLPEPKVIPHALPR